MTFQLAGRAPQIYQQVLVPAWFDRWAEAMITVSALKPGHRVLDVACGTGCVAQRVLARVGPSGQVEGLDINASMLDLAKKQALDLDIAWVQSDVGQIPRPDQHYDRLLCQHGYHYFPDKAAALAELRRVLAPDGIMVLSMWDGHNAYTNALCDAVGRHLSPDIAKTQRAQRTTPSPEETADELRAGGFTEVKIVRQDLRIVVPWVTEFIPLHLGSMPIAAAFEALPDAAQQALITEVAERLADLKRGEQLVYQDAVHVFLASMQAKRQAQNPSTYLGLRHTPWTLWCYQARWQRCLERVALSSIH